MSEQKVQVALRFVLLRECDECLNKKECFIVVGTLHDFTKPPIQHQQCLAPLL